MSRRVRAGLTAFATAIMLASAGAVAAPAQAAPPIKIVKVHWDSPGRDTGSNTSLNAEYVVVKNMTAQTRMLTGWTLRDDAGHVFTFPRTQIGPGRTITVPTGSGTNGPNHRYWGSAWYVWNNTGDTAYLRDAAGAAVSRCRWTAVGEGWRNC